MKYLQKYCQKTCQTNTYIVQIYISKLDIFVSERFFVLLLYMFYHAKVRFIIIYTHTEVQLFSVEVWNVLENWINEQRIVLKPVCRSAL